MNKMMSTKVKKNIKQSEARIKNEIKKGKTKAEKKKILINETNKFIRGEKRSVRGKSLKK
jgi:hypothetical protein